MRQHRSFLGLFLSRSEVGLGLILLIFVLVAMPPGPWSILSLLRDIERVQEEGASTMANVMALEKTRGENQRHIVSYAFLVDGAWVENTSAVSEFFFRSLKVEERLPVRYWMHDPRVAEIEPGWRASQINHGLILRGIMLLFASFWFLPAAKHAARVRWLGRHGTPRQAEVIDVEMYSEEDGGPGWKATWVASDGHTGATDILPIERVPPLRSRITVLTDPTYKRASVWEGDL